MANFLLVHFAPPWLSPVVNRDSNQTNIIQGEASELRGGDGVG